MNNTERDKIDVYNVKKEAGFYYLVAVLIGYFLMNVLYAAIGDKKVAACVAQIAQQATFVLATVLFFNGRGSVKENLMLNSFKPKYLLYAAIVFCGLFFGAGFINIKFTELLQNVGFTVGSAVSIETFGDYLINVVSLSLFPAVCEEFLFRSLFIYALYKVGGDGDEIKTSLLIGIVFALYHKNLAQLIYQFAYGFALSMLALKSGSVIPGMIMHAMNNFIILTVTYFCPTLALFNFYTFVFGLVALVAGFYLLIRKSKKGVLDLRGISPFLLTGIAICVFLGVLNNIQGLL